MPKQQAFVFDLSRCIGCQTCVVACKLENNLDVGENWMRVETLGDPGKNAEKLEYPYLKMSFQPVTCMHCRNAPCVAACPDKAIVRRNDGVVYIEASKCTGCELCLPACPYAVIHFDSRRKLAAKCDFCRRRIDQGLEPFCSLECPTLAINFGDLDGADGEVAKLISRKQGYVLQPETGARPAHHYVG